METSTKVQVHVTVYERYLKKREDLQYIMYLAEQFTHQAHHKTIIMATKVCKSRMYQIIPCTCIHVQKDPH